MVTIMKNAISNFYIKYIKPVLKFIRIIDEPGDLSITNIMVMIFVYKFAQTPMETFSIEAIMPVIGAMALYFGKKIVNKSAGKEVNTQEVSDEVIKKIKEFAKMDSEKHKDSI